MLFTHFKRILKLDRLRLRGPNGAKDEFLLAATAKKPAQARQADPNAAGRARLRRRSVSLVLTTAERKLLPKAAIRNIIRPTQPPPLGAG